MEEIELVPAKELRKDFYLVERDELHLSKQPCYGSFKVMIADSVLWGIYIKDMAKFVRDNGSCTIDVNFAGVPVITIHRVLSEE